MKREIVTHPNPILITPAKPVSKVDNGIRELLADMAETMYAADGIGIAAPQVGVSLRVAVLDLTGTSGDTGLGRINMINPEIISREGEIEWDEGCLSVPDFRMLMKRSSKLTVRFLDENGKKRELAAEGLFAVAVQQELDHLDGKLIIHSASSLKQDLYLKKVKK